MPSATDADPPEPTPADAERVEAVDRVAVVDPLGAQTRAQAEERIQAEKMAVIGRLLPGMSHEINNAFMAILAFSQGLRHDPALPDDLRDSAALFVAETDRVERLVTSLLTFAAQRPPQRYPTTVGALVEDVLALHAYALKGTVAPEVEIPHDLPTIEPDRDQLRLVLVILTQEVLRAITAAGEGRMRIAAAPIDGRDGAAVRVGVMDVSSGVQPEDTTGPRDGSRATVLVSNDSGRTLAVAAGIVRDHGGELRSTPPGARRTAFTFDLPARGSEKGQSPAAGVEPPYGDPSQVPAAEADPRPASTGEPDLTGQPDHTGEPDPAALPRVLVVDDEPSVRILLGKQLTHLGYEPTLCASAAVAVTIADDSFRAVLCDHQMPGMSGVELHAALATTHPALAARFVVMSGDIGNPRLTTFAGEQQVRVLAKPFDMDTLRRTMAEVVAGDQPRG